jgi:hypothetical protein
MEGGLVYLTSNNYFILNNSYINKVQSKADGGAFLL